MQPLHKLLIVLLVMTAVVAGFSLGRIIKYQRQTEAAALPAPEFADPTGRPRPDFTLMDMEQRSRSISEWDGKALLINFWATWCQPCREEIPALNRIRNEYRPQGFEVIGIALDWPEAVAEFRRQISIDYPILAGQADADEVMRRYGNSSGGLPYSVFIDAGGSVRQARAGGPLSARELQTIVSDLLEN